LVSDGTILPSLIIHNSPATSLSPQLSVQLFEQSAPSLRPILLLCQYILSLAGLFLRVWRGNLRIAPAGSSKNILLANPKKSLTSPEQYVIM
jgi:hypothetical protein